ncbi:hypothetical protein [Brevibacillus brevis]|uniref:hypothetical protein n=1 Tax=Brevibacillus brevis TaxID=1393 RepID=UPI001EDC279A|nr:hypothetical protein [Brevibacillus brevis]UKK97617.1 hypothetical protein FO446_09385 [Brevibacillus brevis]
MSAQTFEYFKHFLECYFNISADYSDLKDLLSFYKSTESEKTRIELLGEINTLIDADEWTYAHSLIKEHGMRNMKHENIIEMLLLMRDMLK